MPDDTADLEPYQELIVRRLSYDQQVDKSDLRPYTSLVVARTMSDGELLVNQILEDIKQHVIQLGAERIVTESEEIPAGAMELGQFYVRFLHYIELRAPGWYNWPQVLRDKDVKLTEVRDRGTAEEDFKVEDVLNHLAIVCQRNQHVAIYLSDSRRRREVVRSLGKQGRPGLGPLEPISPGTLKAAFVRQYESMREDSVVRDKYPVRTLWLSGIHAPALVKPDSKILAGRNLRHALDPLGDQTYCFTAARSFIHDLELAVGVSPRGSRVWAGLSKEWTDFEERVVLLLSELEETERANRQLQAPLPVLATLSGREQLAELSAPFELHWAPPELQVDDPDADYWTAQRMERWAYRASFDNLRFCPSPLGVVKRALQQEGVGMTWWHLPNQKPQPFQVELELEPCPEPAELRTRLAEIGCPADVEPTDGDGSGKLIATFNADDLKDEPSPYLLQADAEVEGEQVGQLQVELDITNPQHVSIRATAQPNEESDREYQEDLTRLCRRTNWMKMWFESGHTIANGAIYLIQHRDQPFESFRWADFSGYEVDWEKFWEGNRLARVYGQGFSQAAQENARELDGVSEVTLVVHEDCLQLGLSLALDTGNGVLQALEQQLKGILAHAEPLTVHWFPDQESGTLAGKVYGLGLDEAAREAVENIPQVDSTQLLEWDAYLEVKLEKSDDPLLQTEQLKDTLQAAGAQVTSVHRHGWGLDKAAVGQHGSLFCWVLNEWADPSVNPLSVERGWLACDDGSGEIADFIHLHVPNDGAGQPLLSLIHVKCADRNEPVRTSIKVGAYQEVSTQAVKNLRFLDQACQRKSLVEGAGKTISDLVWLDGVQVKPDDDGRRPRDQMCEALGKIGASYRRQVIVLQPQLTRHWYDRARKAERRQSIDPGYDPPGSLRADIERLRQLDTLLLSAQASCHDLSADFYVLVDKR
jgi:hypothetical protein